MQIGVEFHKKPTNACNFFFIDKLHCKAMWFIKQYFIINMFSYRHFSVSIY